MQSPFPGIDPFVEAAGRWRDFHVRFMNAWCDAISEKLPQDYAACLEEQLTILEYEEERRQPRAPDITIVQTGAEVAARSAGAAVAERVTPVPEVSRILIQDEIRQAYIQILQLPDLHLVAVLELLSQTNKSGDGRVQYLAKRQELLHSKAHLVELDLLLGGKRLPFEKPISTNPFYFMVSRVDQRPDCDVYSWTLRDKLPEVPIPLSRPDADMVVDLGKVLSVPYSRAQYEKLINYQMTLDFPLSSADKAWIKEQVGQG
jgi:hypothetical protein